MAEQRNDFSNQWAKVVARAWADEGFKKRLLAQPAAVLKEAGVVLPEGVQCKLMENTERLVHLVLPLAPSSSELTEEALQAVSGGLPYAGCHCAVK